METDQQGEPEPQAGTFLTISSAVSLRRERTVEVEQVNSLAVEAFGRPVLGSLLTSLRSSPAWVGGLSFVATEGDRVVGHVLFSRGWVDAPRELVDVLVLSPLAVAPKWQGRGIGSALVRHGLEQIDSRREPLVFLEGSPRFYPRFGFEPAGPLGFLRPSPRIPEAAFMAQRTPSYEPWMTGTLVYPDAFWRHDCVGRRDS